MRNVLTVGLILSLLPTAGCGVAGVDELVADLSSDDVKTRRAAAEELGHLTLKDAHVVRALESAAGDRDREVRRLCCFALGELGAGQEALTRAVDDGEMSVRLAAAYALLKLDPAHPAAIDVLTKSMKQGDGGVIVAVSGQRPAAQWAIPTLIGLLNDDRPGIRRLAVDALGDIGLASPDVISALQRAQRDPDDRVRESVVAAINQINGV